MNRVIKTMLRKQVSKVFQSFQEKQNSQLFSIDLSHQEIVGDQFMRKRMICM